jgi:hypothetical protein
VGSGSEHRGELDADRAVDAVDAVDPGPGPDPAADEKTEQRARGQTGPTSRAAQEDLRRSRSEQARVRGQVAGNRAAELRERQVRLQVGGVSTVEDLTAAREALAEGLRQAEIALERAGEAYERAAEAHDRVAHYLEQLALAGGPGAQRRTVQALRHRTAAAADRAAGRRDAGPAAAGREPPA